MKKVASLLVFLLLLPGCLGFFEKNDERNSQPTEGGVIPLPNYNTVQRSSPKLQTYAGCAPLLEDLRKSFGDEARAILEDQRDHWNGYYAYGHRQNDILDMGIPELAMADEAATSSNTASQSKSPGMSSNEVKSLIEGEDFSGTNNQEAGVDEADFIKTDGNNIYVLNAGHLFILGVPEFGSIEHSANISIEGEPTQMLMSGNRIVVASMVHPWTLSEGDSLRTSMLLQEEEENWRWETFTKLTLVDIENRSDPIINREIYIEGDLLTGREFNGTVRMITHGWIDIPYLKSWVELADWDAYWSANDDEKKSMWNRAIDYTILDNEDTLSKLEINDMVPRIYERTDNGSIDVKSYGDDDCKGFAGAKDASSRGVTSILSIDLNQTELSFTADHIRTNWPQIYASGDLLVLSEKTNEWWWYWGNQNEKETTNLHTFDISVSGQTTYVASGRINGTILNQFSLSEHEEILRVASTTGQWGRWWLENPEPIQNHVICLEIAIDGAGEKYLSEIGHLGGIAKNENIWSARFVGDRAYIVTFRQTDPLWTIDLSDPQNPSIFGELKVPGVSTYIHPLSDGNHLLTIGFPGGDDGLGLDWSTTQISLFDISNVSDPKLAKALPLTPGYTDSNCLQIRWCGWQWSNSEATYEHKAFTYWEASSLLAVPISTSRWTYDEVEINGKTYANYGYEYVSKLMMIDVNASEGNLAVQGNINHSGHFGKDGLTSTWWGGDISIRRSIFMGNYIYAFSDAAVTVHWTENLTQTDEIKLPGKVSTSIYRESIEPVMATTSSSPNNDE